MKSRIFSLILLLATICGAQAQDKRDLQALQALESSLHYQQGTITLEKGMAKVTLPDQFRYLSPQDTETVLVKMWKNPTAKGTLGMITPAGQSLLKRDSWAIIISYADDGYIKDSDADKIDYAKLLKSMQDQIREVNPTREKQGYPAIELVGWATPPTYDRDTHKLYWAKELKFTGAKHNTLNYNIRVLGRRGVLVLNAVASMDQFSEIQQQTPEIVKMVEFTEGNRYADFDSHTDKVAAYGLAALIAGGIAAKAGFFKLLWVGLIAVKKFVVIGALAVWAFIKKLFAGRNANQT